MPDSKGKLASLNVEDVSRIREYFDGKTVLLTGGTGFVGKLIVEKLLRACSGVKRIYLLVRENKGVDPHERLKQMLNVQAFDALKAQSPNFFSKLSICFGDCLLPDLGLSPKDLEVLKQEVNCVLYSAATVRFDASLKGATYTNVRSVRDLLKIMKEMRSLTSFVYVSTAYSNCPRSHIDEVFYDPPIEANKLIALVDSQDDDLLDAITPSLIGQWPNTYSFTKAVVEDLIKTEAENLPVAIVRPSIITAASQEPLPGWVDNISGLTGALLGLSLGLLRIVRCNKKYVADIIPVDFVVNVILAAAWSSSEKCNVSKPDNIVAANEILVYNFVSGSQNPMTWDEFQSVGFKYADELITSSAVWYPTITMTNSKYLYLLGEFFLHTVPAYIVDFFLSCMGKKPLLVKIYVKIASFSRILEYFSIREWHFKNDNTQQLWGELTRKDKELFNFDISKLSWSDYFRSYLAGISIHLIKVQLYTVSQARRKYFVLKVAHFTLLTILLLCLGFLLRKMFTATLLI